MVQQKIVATLVLLAIQVFATSSYADPPSVFALPDRKIREITIDRKHVPYKSRVEALGELSKTLSTAPSDKPLDLSGYVEILGRESLVLGEIQSVTPSGNVTLEKKVQFIHIGAEAVLDLRKWENPKAAIAVICRDLNTGKLVESVVGDGGRNHTSIARTSVKWQIPALPGKYELTAVLMGRHEDEEYSVLDVIVKVFEMSK